MTLPGGLIGSSCSLLYSDDIITILFIYLENLLDYNTRVLNNPLLEVFFYTLTLLVFSCYILTLWFYSTQYVYSNLT